MLSSEFLQLVVYFAGIKMVLAMLSTLTFQPKAAYLVVFNVIKHVCNSFPYNEFLPQPNYACAAPLLRAQLCGVVWRLSLL